jgi:phosphatidylglycerophosphate synthase
VHERKAEHVLRAFEAFVLPRLARALPAWVLPDHLTALAGIAALGTGTCLALSGQSPLWLWGANAWLLVHWLGDSLDGTLARERRIERPRYGFYLDHLMDMLSVAAIFVGFGLSPYLSWSVALTMIVSYYLVAIHTHLQLETLGTYEIALGGIGPTEGRLFFMLCNVALAHELVPIAALDPVALGVAGSMLVFSGLRSLGNLRRLSREEPANVRRVPAAKALARAPIARTSQKPLHP